MQMRGLSAGIYTLTMLVGRGNSFGTASSTYDLTGNIEGLSATLLDYSAGSNASLSGTTLFSESGAGEWALVEYTFTVTKDNTTLSLTSNGTGNINALALSSIPEPATASRLAGSRSPGDAPPPGLMRLKLSHQWRPQQ